MTAPRFVRGSRSRVFLSVGGVMFLGLCVFFFHGTQMQLEEVRKVSDKCQQQQESLAAQLQVVFEYKLRLEKSLQQEKAEHRLTKEQFQQRLEEEKELREKENLEHVNKYSSLQQQYKILNSQNDDLNEDCTKIRTTNLQNMDEIATLRNHLKSVSQELEQIKANKDKAFESLKNQYLKIETENSNLVTKNQDLVQQAQSFDSKVLHLQKENAQLNRQLEKMRNLLLECQGKCDPGAPKKDSENVLSNPKDVSSNKVSTDKTASSSPVVPAVHHDHGEQQEPMNVLPEPNSNHLSGDKTSRSTTPQINPDAVQSQEKNQVVNVGPPPIPHDAADNKPENNVQEKKREAQHEVEEGVGPAPDWNNEDQQQLPANVPQQPPFHAQESRNWQNNIPHGVVPIPPQGYNFNQVDLPEVNAGEGGGQWGPFWHKPQPPLQRPDNVPHHPEVANDNQLKRPYGRLDEHPIHRQYVRAIDHDRIDEEEAPRRNHNNGEYNGDYDKDGQKGGGGDIQLDEGEEEEDDDVDQLDYEAGNPQKKLKHIPVRMPVMQPRKDSIMVHPH